MTQTNIAKMAESKGTDRAANLLDLPPNFKLELPNQSISLRCRQQGFKFFSENYLHDVYMTKFDDTVRVAAKCHRSQRKNEAAHKLSLDICKGQIQYSYCSCTAG